MTDLVLRHRRKGDVLLQNRPQPGPLGIAMAEYQTVVAEPVKQINDRGTQVAGQVGGCEVLSHASYQFSAVSNESSVTASQTLPSRPRGRGGTPKAFAFRQTIRSPANRPLLWLAWSSRTRRP